MKRMAEAISTKGKAEALSTKRMVDGPPPASRSTRSNKRIKSIRIVIEDDDNDEGSE